MSKLQATEEQLLYAKLLDMGMKIGMLSLIITFIIYAFGILTPQVPVNDLPKYWEMKVGNYLYVMSQIEENKADQAVALINECKTSQGHGPVPEKCKEINEKGHKFVGWSWLARLGKGDFVNFLGIAFLSGVTILCYIAIIPILFRKKDTVYGILAILEVLVLVLAASGILKSGGH